MNTFFGGKLTDQDISAHCEALLNVSNKYSDHSPEIVTIRLPHQYAIVAVRGKNGGVGYYEDDTYTIVMEGEIFNSEIFNHEISTGTNIRDRWAYGFAKELMKGEDKLFSSINGIYSVVVFDKHLQRFSFFRDKKGYRFIHYAFQQDGTICFASRLWQVADILQSPVEINVGINLFQYVNNFFPLSSTVVSPIKKVRPGFILHYSIESGATRERQISFDTRTHGRKKNPKTSKLSDATSVLYTEFLDSLERVLETTFYSSV